MKYVILSGGYPPSEKLLRLQLKDSDKLIGVDGAADVLSGYGITADYIVGDFDTARKSNVLEQQNGGAEVLRLKTRKNVTDTEAAIELAIENGASQIVLLGAVGSRQDHTLSNIFLLKYAYDHGAHAKILDENNEMFIITGSFTLHSTKGHTVSILPLCKDITVTAKGLEYPLEELVLRFGSSRGVSNVMKSTEATITVDGGLALIILTDGSL